MSRHSVSDGQAANIAPIPNLHKLLDPVFLDAHQLIDRVPRRLLARMIPMLKRAAQASLAPPTLLNPVDKKILPSAAWMELPKASPPAPGASGPTGRLFSRLDGEGAGAGACGSS